MKGEKRDLISRKLGTLLDIQQEYLNKVFASRFNQACATKKRLGTCRTVVSSIPPRLCQPHLCTIPAPPPPSGPVVSVLVLAAAVSPEVKQSAVIYQCLIGPIWELRKPGPGPWRRSPELIKFQSSPMMNVKKLHPRYRRCGLVWEGGGLAEREGKKCWWVFCFPLFPLGLLLSGLWPPNFSFFFLSPPFIPPQKSRVWSFESGHLHVSAHTPLVGVE